jgi:hypothetical protein
MEWSLVRNYRVLQHRKPRHLRLDRRLLLEWCIVDHAVSRSDAEELTKNALNDEGVFYGRKTS